MKHRLFKRYFLGMATIVVISLCIMMLLLFVTYNNQLSNEKYDELKNICVSVSKTATEVDGGEIEDKEVLSSTDYLISDIKQFIDCDIYVTDETGSIVVCRCDESYSRGTCGHIGTVVEIKELKLISSGKEKVGTAGFYATPQYIAAAPIKNSGKEIGYVLAAASSQPLKLLINKSVKIFLLSSLIPLVIMFIALYIMSYRMNKPLKLMSEAAHAMAKGDFSRRIPVTSDDEIGELAASFNAMTNSLSRLEETRKSFIANVSHEMRTPMTTIGGFIDGIIDGTIEPEKQNYYLNIASNEVKRLSRMIQSMLNLSRLESSEFVLKSDRFDLREQILNVVLSQEQRIEEKNIEIKGLDTLPSVIVSADKDLIYQAVYNLVDNAIKFVNDGGYITFSLGVDASGADFTVANSGAGIPSADLPFIFDRFYKLDKSRAANKNSMGLGLYIVKTIIKNHGGTISVTSKENEFTQFEFVLPLGK